MTIATTIQFFHKGRFGDLNTGIAEPAAGQYIRRDSISDAIHHAGSPVLHETYSYLMENRNLNHLISGAWEIVWEWEAGEYTEEQIDNFISQVPMPRWTTVKDFANNTVTRTLTDANYEITGWESPKPDYTLKTANVTIKATSDAKMFCLALLNGTYSDYTVECTTIEPNATLNIAKQGTTCYFIPMGEVTVSKNVLTPFQTYALSSNSIDVLNSGSTRVRVTRVWK